MGNRLTVKQEKFCINYFKCGNASEAAILAKYSPRTAGVIACENLKKPKVLERLKELQEKAASAKIMDVIERKERLSEIARVRLSDLVSCGPDGSWINVGLDGCQSAGIQAIKSSTEYDKDGDHPTVITDIKLYDSVKAIAELNKMEHIYEEGNTVNIDNHKVLIIVESEKQKRITEALMSGECGIQND